jgi:hypothetical protein
MDRQTLFWQDKWLDGVSIRGLAPDLCMAVSKRASKTRLVSDALLGDRWIWDISCSLSVLALQQYASLWVYIQQVQLHPNSPDRFTWKWSSSQKYSSASAYPAFFHGQCAVSAAKELRKTRAPANVKFFVWLAILDRCWTTERRQRHNLQGNADCNLCGQAVEFIHHMLLGCVYSREVWVRLLRSIGLLHLCPAQDAALAPWWLAGHKSLPKERRRGFDSLVTLVWWNIWRERNSRVFNDAMKQAAELASWIHEEGGQWIHAGCSRLSALLQ